MAGITLTGDINRAIAFGKTKIGVWKYDHDAAQNTRFGQTNKEADCSGFVSRCLWEGGMPRYFAGFGESSNMMATWVQKHPEFRLPISAAATTFGAIWVVGGTGGWGDAGHTGFSLGGGLTLESASGLGGVQVGKLSRLKISDVMLAPVSYHGIPIPPPPHEPEDDMFRVIKGDKKAEVWLTNWLIKRYIGTPQEIDAIIKAGVTAGAAPVTWPQAFVDSIPVAK